MTRYILSLIIIFNFSISALSQDLTKETNDGKITMQSFSAQSNLYPVMRAEYRVLFSKIGFNAAVEGFDKTPSDADLFLYDANFSQLPSSISDTSINFHFNGWEYKSFEVQLGIGSGTDIFMFADENDLPKWFVRFGAEFSYGRRFAHQLHGYGYYKVTTDSVTNETIYYDSNNEAVNSQDDAAKLISNFQLSKYITHEVGAQIFGSVEYFLMGSRLSFGLRLAGGATYSWLYQYHGTLEESQIDADAYTGMGPKMAAFATLGWSF